MSAFIQTGTTEPISVYTVDKSGDALTGLTDLYIRVYRHSDGYLLDWNDMTFKASGWTTLDKILTEIDATNLPGLYRVTGGLNTGSITNPSADDTYVIYPLQTPGTTAHLPAPQEIKVGHWADQIDDIETDTNEAQGKLPTNNIMGSSVKTDKDDEVDAIKAKTDNLPADPASETNVDANETKIDAIQTDVTSILTDTNEMQGKLPTNNLMGSSVKTDKDGEIDAILTDTAAMQPTIATNLDATVSSREAESDAATRASTNQTEHDATQTAIGALNDLSAQDVRDSMKLAPAVGVPAVGSVDDHLDDILTDTSTMQPLVSTNLDATVSSRSDFDETADPVELLDTGGVAGTSAAELVVDIESKLATDHGSGQWDDTDSDWTSGEKEQIRDALGVGGTKSASTGGKVQDILADTNEAQTKLPDTFIMGSSDSTDHDDEIIAIKAKTDNLPADPADESNQLAQHTATQAAITALNDPSASAVATAVWTEAAATGGVGTMGELQRRLDDDVTSRAAPGAAMDLVTDAVDAAAVATTGANEIRDAILADSTPFNGASIDAAVSSRAAPGAAMDLVNDAVDTNSLATSAVNDIADQVWEEAIADHKGTVGSTAEALDAAGGGVTAAAVADAVWDEDITTHTAADSAGEAQNLLDAIDTDTSAIDSRLPVSPGNETTLQAAIAALTDVTATEVRDAILSDSTPFAGADIAAIKVKTDNLPADPADESNQQAQHAATQAAIVAQNDLNATEVRNALLTDGTKFAGADIAAIDAKTTNLPADPADESNQLAQHSTTQAAIAALNDLDGTAVEDAVWDADHSLHQGTGTTGKSLADAGATADPAAIADAVWEEPRADHVGSTTMGGAQKESADARAQANKIDSAATVDPSTAVSGSLLDRLCNKDGSKTYDQSSDALEAVRDRIG